ncbi:hypothetical protein G7Y89_g13244 [Cudoniella acicularis]|uniref:Uncharacterized protein n=1 Tax=Cudoniella acicularis TaxID=354080 RepID=A0A8H4VW91_9HELO|nr:hypothetical protein G7Y89_g13244 [Cudoniella acicularis]
MLSLFGLWLVYRQERIFKDAQAIHRDVPQRPSLSLTLSAPRRGASFKLEVPDGFCKWIQEVESLQVEEPEEAFLPRENV